MYTLVNIQKYKEGPEGTTLVIGQKKDQKRGTADR